MADMHLLILDDDERILAFIGPVARERGWTTETSTREAQFHAYFLARRPDAIMLDLQLGDTDGIEQLRFLHRESYTGPIVLMSGFDQRVLASAQRLGQSLGLTIVAVLEKPARAAHVREVLEGAEHRIALGTKGPSLAPAASPAPVSAGTGDFRPEDISNALQCGECELYLQPIVSAADFSVVQLEALIRWQHPERGLILPDEFIPVAEQDEAVIDRLFQWVAQTALDHYRYLDALGLAYPIAINISSRNLHSLDFPDRLETLVLNYGVAPDTLALEITESAAMRDPDAVIDILTRLRLKGFQIAIDDFGTAYSSLKTLRQMPFNEIKFDKSFIDELQNSRESMLILKSVIDLARDMQLTSVAEGVETQAVARQLVELGVGCLQGYCFSAALPIDQLVVWLKTEARFAI